MKFDLTHLEIRIIACLIEKEITTPDQYPLSVNALTSACNQKSNREPVMDLHESDVQSALDGLKKKYLVSAGGGFGSRVTKYRHRFCNTEFGDLQLSDPEVAVLCELMLRGPQTPGELRSRGERMCPMAGIEHAESALEKLMQREEPLVAKLPREPGKREARYMHLLCGDAPPPSFGASESIRAPNLSDRERIVELELAVAELRAELESLKRSLGS